jgi:hypothetical protein
MVVSNSDNQTDFLAKSYHWLWQRSTVVPTHQKHIRDKDPTTYVFLTVPKSSHPVILLWVPYGRIFAPVKATGTGNVLSI